MSTTSLPRPTRYSGRVRELMGRVRLRASERRVIARAERRRVQPLLIAKALQLCRKHKTDPTAIGFTAAMAITRDLRRELKRSA